MHCSRFVLESGEEAAGDHTSEACNFVHRRDLVIVSTRRLLGIMVAGCTSGLAISAAAPIAAQADLVSLSACDNAALSQPFTQWADPDYYKLAPGGDFEGSL